MNRIILLVVLAGSISRPAFGQTIQRCDHENNQTDEGIEEEFRRLHAYEAEIILRGDVEALDAFYPEDHIVTNPFNQMLDKATVLERVRGNVIKYDAYEKDMEYLCVYEDIAIIAGVETGTAAEDANRPDAGKLSARRFTETWMKRGEQWRKVARHVSTIAVQ